MQRLERITGGGWASLSAGDESFGARQAGISCVWLQAPATKKFNKLK